MGQFETELREAIENGDTKRAFRAAALLIDILPEIREMAWRTIESAPKDGGCVFAKWENENGTFYGRIYWDDHFENWSDGYYPLSISKVTHWMPVPSNALTEKLKKEGVLS